MSSWYLELIKKRKNEIDTQNKYKTKYKIKQNIKKQNKINTMNKYKITQDRNKIRTNNVMGKTK